MHLALYFACDNLTVCVALQNENPKHTEKLPPRRLAPGRLWKAPESTPG